MASTDNLRRSLHPQQRPSAATCGGAKPRRGRLLLGVNVFLVLCAGAIALFSWARGWHSASVAPLHLSEARLVQRRTSAAVVEALVAQAAEQVEVARTREHAQAAGAGADCRQAQPLQAREQQRDCLGWKAGNEAVAATRAAWQQLAALRAAAQEAAAGAAADWAWAAANSKPGALTQAVARRLLGLMKERQVTREAVCDAVLGVAEKAGGAAAQLPSLPLLLSLWLLHAACGMLSSSSAFNCSCPFQLRPRLLFCS